MITNKEGTKSRKQKIKLPKYLIKFKDRKILTVLIGVKSILENCSNGLYYYNR